MDSMHIHENKENKTLRVGGWFCAALAIRGLKPAVLRARAAS